MFFTNLCAFLKYCFSIYFDRKQKYKQGISLYNEIKEQSCMLDFLYYSCSCCQELLRHSLLMKNRERLLSIIITSFKAS